MTRVVKVCRVSDLAPGEKMALNVSGEDILLVNYNGKFYGVSNVCTHEHVELVNGFLIDDSIVCPAHLSAFLLETGEVFNPPAILPLKTYKTSIQNDEVCIEV